MQTLRPMLSAAALPATGLCLLLVGAAYQSPSRSLLPQAGNELSEENEVARAPAALNLSKQILLRQGFRHYRFWLARSRQAGTAHSQRESRASLCDAVRCYNLTADGMDSSGFQRFPLPRHLAMPRQ